MSFDSVFVGQFALAFAIISAGLSFVLGKKKTTTPVLCSVVGFLSGLIPPLGIIFLAVLVFKNDK